MKKLELNQLKNYLGTGLAFHLMFDSHEEYNDLCEYDGFNEAFSKGALWEFVGWSDITIPLGDGEFDSELLKYGGIYRGNYGDSKPIMYRLSDLDKMIPELCFVPIEELLKIANTQISGEPLDSNQMMLNKLDLFQKLFEWHFWIFDQSYFDEGLIIDKLTLK
jgi:hypothetical protein